MFLFRADFPRPTRRWRRFAALASGTALTVTIVTIGVAAPAMAQSNGEVYLASAEGFDLYVPGDVEQGAEMRVGTDVLPNAQWTVTDKGPYDGHGVTGEGEQFANYGTNWCIADTVNPGGGTSTPNLQACGANGTVWVACRSGDGYLLFDRYLLNNGGTANLLGINFDAGDGETLLLVNENYVSSDWFIRWDFPIPGPTPPACTST
jgi:hypothetical protein